MKPSSVLPPSVSDPAALPGKSVWPISRFKHLATLRAGEAITAESIDVTGAYPVYGGNGVRGYSARFTHDGERVLVGRQGALCGNVHYVQGRYWASEHAIVVRPQRHVSARWLAYLARCLNLGQYSQSTAQPGIGTAQIASLRVHCPSLEEQRAIVNYLDRETTRIDKLLTKQERLIETLRERRAAINDMTRWTAGSRPTVLRRVLTRLSRSPVPSAGVVTAYRDGQVTLRANRRGSGYTESLDQAGYQGVRSGDLVFHALDGFAGACGVSDSEGNVTPVYHVCTPTQGDNPAFVALVLRHLGTSGFLATQAPNVRQLSVDFRNWETFGRVPVHLPGPDVQGRAVDEINEETAKIDLLIAKTERFIELSRERRSALITAAVTGQIDVREAA